MSTTPRNGLLGRVPDTVPQESLELEGAGDRAGTTSRYMGNPTPTEFEQLRQSFDGSDHFMRGGAAVFGKAGGHHNNRIANMHLTDPWAFDDKQMRLLFQRVFPNIDTKRETETQH